MKMISYTDNSKRVHSRWVSDVVDMVTHNSTLVIHFKDKEYWVIGSDKPAELLFNVQTWMSSGEFVDINLMDRNLRKGKS